MNGTRNIYLMMMNGNFDAIPEIFNGENIADFIDPEILQRLDEMEKEEEERAIALGNEMEDSDDNDSLGEDDMEKVREIKERKKVLVQRVQQKKHTNGLGRVPRSADLYLDIDKMEETLRARGIDPSKASERIRSESRGRKRARSESQSAVDAEIESKIQRTSKSRSRTPSRGDGFRDMKQLQQAEKIGKDQRKVRNKEAKKGEGDRHVYDLKPKHLLTGKRGAGKTDRR